MVFVQYFKGYFITYSNKAKKELKTIDQIYAQKINVKLAEVAAGLQHVDIKRIYGYPNRFRLRVGVYRVVFEAHEKTHIIEIVSVGARGDVYK